MSYKWAVFALTVTVMVVPAAGFARTPAGRGQSAGVSAPRGGESAETVGLGELMKPMSSTTTGTVNVEGQTIHYKAVAGTLVIHGTGAREFTPEVAMSYFAYFKQGASASKRPVTFLYNGGPGSSTVWLLMGAYGPERVVTNDHTHTPPAPYGLVNNDYSLLNATDLVFIDMPGTGFGRFLPQGKTGAARAKDRRKLENKIWSADGDARVFARFITQFLTKYQRWDSPKYIYGESYGTTRSAVLAADLELHDRVDLNGVILQSQILNFNLSIDGTHADPGVIMPYVLALPSFAATAWYHRQLPLYDNGKLDPLLTKVIQFAKTQYEPALVAGSTLSEAKERAIATQLHDFTGLPAAYWVKAGLKVSGTMFEHELLSSTDTTTGRLDTRFAGPSMDPLSERSEYDPQSAAIGSAYVAAFNTYVRKDLRFGFGMKYRPNINRAALKGFHWSMAHRAPGTRFKRQGGLNVMPDLAAAMKFNPDLKVMLNGGFFDLATPFYTAIYEEEHLPIPRRLDRNITYAFYPSGHMIYVHVPSLHRIHDNVTKFIDATDHEGK